MTKDDKTEKLRKSYQFFQKMQKSGTLFSSEDIAVATGWGKSTIRTYRSKKWADILVEKPEKQFAADLSRYATEEAYVRMMSQNYEKSLDPYKPELPENVEELVVKARDSAILAVDIYNRPVTSFRSQGYIVMMVIAWTALFHAIFEMDKVDYFYKNNDGSYKIIEGDKKARELDHCLDKGDNLISEAEKQNLRFFVSLRNKIEHRYVPAFDIDILGECQAMLLNFENLLVQRFGSYYALNQLLSFSLQVSSTKSDEQQRAIRKIQSDHYGELREYVKLFRNSLSDDVYDNEKYSFRFF